MKRSIQQDITITKRYTPNTRPLIYKTNIIRPTGIESNSVQVPSRPKIHRYIRADPQQRLGTFVSVNDHFNTCNIIQGPNKIN